MNEEVQKLFGRYYELMESQQIREQDLDFSLFQKHKQFLTYMAQVDNSAITIFDLYKKEHVFASYNFTSLFGYDLEKIESGGNEFFNSKVHPDDFIAILKSSIRIFEYFLSVSKEQRINLKAINEYRVLNGNNQYVRVIEQHQVLELDRKGNVWLSLGVVDISPNQDSSTLTRTQVLNFKTGQLIKLPVEKTTANNPTIELSSREKEVLVMVKEGLLSKEISEKLYISVHTVNTHRQRILEKLNANNSQEAIKYASALGLLE